MRTTKPRAIPTILRLIDWLNMVLGAWQLERKVRVRRYSARPTMNRMKPAFLISMFGAQAFAVPAGFGSSGLAIGAQIAGPFVVNDPACNSRTPMNAQAKDRDALAAATPSDVNGLKRLPERQLLPQISRSRTHIEMTGVRPTATSTAAIRNVR